MIFTFLSFLFVVGVLVIVHEFGHFVVAKKMGVRVDEFSIGLPPKMLTLFRKGDTDYILSWLPFGGYVKMAGQHPEDELTGAPDEFQSKSPGQRFWIIFAGPAMNYIFAFFLFAGIIYFSGIDIPNTAIIEVEKNSLAEKIGLQTGDQLLSIGNQEINDWKDVINVFEKSPAFMADIKFERNGEQQTLIGIHFPENAYQHLNISPINSTSIGDVQKDSPADLAGLKKHDLILKIDDKSVKYWHEMSDIIFNSPEKPLNFVIKRQDSTFIKIITPRLSKISVSEDSLREVGMIGIKTDFVTEKISLMTASVMGFEYTLRMSQLIFVVLKKIGKGEFNKDMIGGPVAIGQVAGDTARWGFDSLLTFMAALSVQLALLNLFIPVPVLDGGQIMIIFIEKLRGRALSEKNRMRLVQFGVLFLILLMILVTLIDITR